MKKALLFLFFLFAISHDGLAQVDSLDRPVFHSVLLEVDTLRDCIVYTNYYTIRNNIDNKHSSAFISENPTIDELLNFTCIKPSYSFVVIMNNTISNMIVLEPAFDNNQMTYAYVITNSNSGKKITIASKLTGSISELRSAELIRNGYDKNARALQNETDKFCFFGGSYYQIQSFQTVKKEVLAIIVKDNLANPDIDLDTLQR